MFLDTQLISRTVMLYFLGLMSKMSAITIWVWVSEIARLDIVLPVFPINFACTAKQAIVQIFQKPHPCMWVTVNTQREILLLILIV